MTRSTGLRKSTRLGGQGQIRDLLRFTWGWLSHVGRSWALTLLGLLTLERILNGGLRAPNPPELFSLIPVTALTIAAGWKLLKYHVDGSVVTRRMSELADLGTGTLILAFALTEMTGGPTSLLYPLIYAVLAFWVSFSPRRLAWALVLGAAALELMIGAMLPRPSGWSLVVSHLSFLALFALLFALFMRGHVAKQNTQFRVQLEEQLETISREAQDFRLTSALSLDSRDLSSEELVRRRRVGSIQAIHDTLYQLLGFAELALEPHTVAVFWATSSSDSLQLRELRSDSDYVSGRRIGVGEGLLGAVVKKAEPIVLSDMRAGHPGIVYYDRPTPVKHFVGIPLLDAGVCRGVLVADRVIERSFDDKDVALLTEIALQTMRVVEVERLFSELDREKYQKERFYQASRDFNSALNIEDVGRVAVEAAKRVSGLEFAAIAVSSEEDDMMKVVAALNNDEAQAKELIGRVFDGRQGLVGASIKARHPLPHGSAMTRQQHVFEASIDLALKTVKVFPLIWGDFAVGALVVGSAQERNIALGTFDMVSVIGDHAATAIANAQMYERMEMLATTDGLTAMTNHRTFQERFDELIKASDRYGRQVTLVLCDIDHFKSINDTYGHPVGDIVLKRVAQILKSSSRETDVVARYGGEEFAILMDETDGQGALQIAERVRQNIMAEVFHSEQGPFQCTMSLGVATYPNDGKKKELVIVAADEALYHAKRSGRNQSVRAGTFKS